MLLILNMVCDRNMLVFQICQGYTRFLICVSMLLSNARIYLNMSEAEPKITVQAKEHCAKIESCQISKIVSEGASCKNNYNLELFSNAMSDRDINTVEILNIPGF